MLPCQARSTFCLHSIAYSYLENFVETHGVDADNGVLSIVVYLLSAFKCSFLFAVFCENTGSGAKRAFSKINCGRTLCSEANTR